MEIILKELRTQSPVSFRNTRATQIVEVTINFSIIKQNKVIGKINVINADIRFSDKVNEPIKRFIKKHNTPKHKIIFNQGRRSILSFVI